MKPDHQRADEISEYLDPDDLAALLAPQGALSRVLEGYEQRPEQEAMLRAVVKAFDQDRVLMVEAGTGVGKSLAYCLPAACYARASGERVVLSTGTINLQEQLVGKDLPLVGRALGHEVDFVLIKGRSNYVCRRRLAQKARQRQLVDLGRLGSDLDRLVAFADLSADGSRSDLDVPVDSDIWSMVASDADACPGKRCPHRGECFFIRARARAEQAELLVVNHHLLFADLALRNQLGDSASRAVLPPFERLVLDEAHGLEDVASGFFGTQLTRRGALATLGRISPTGNRQGPGLLAEVNAELSALGAGQGWGRTGRDLDLRLGEARKAYQQAFDSLVGFSSGLVAARGPSERCLRLTPGVYGQPGWIAVREDFMRAAELTDQLAGSLGHLVARWDGLSEEDGRSAEAHGAVRRLQNMAEACRELMDEEPGQLVRWAEWPAQRDGRFAKLAAAPLDVAGLLGESMFRKLSSVVLTSATIQVAGSFDFLSSRLGAREQASRLDELLVYSPFDYPEQCLLALAVDAPEPNQRAFSDWLPQALLQLVAASGGGALVLFTAWGTMTRAFNLIEAELESLGLEALCQGQAPRDKLLSRFRDQDSSVLFGTDSFWQGVDVIGPSLRQVIITRLPFDVPSDPLIQARSELVQAEGGSPFADFSLPRAVLKFKQGFGRLIRSGRDRGVVTVLDQRISSRSYGRKFLDSLPQTSCVDGTLDDLTDRIEDFLGAAETD